MTQAELWAVWVTAGATILAALVPLVLFLFERKDRKAAEQALEKIRARDDEERRSGQAKRVTLWTERYREEYDFDGPMKTRCYVHNGSDMPIFNYEMYAFRLVGDEHTGQPVRRRIHEANRGNIPPGQDRDISLGWLNTNEPVWVKFTDALGQTWFRCQDGTQAKDEEKAMERMREQAVHELPQR